MKLKKLTLLALALALCLSLTACQHQDAYDLYMAATEKASGYRSVQYNIKANMTMSDGTDNINLLMDGTAKQIIRSVTDQDMAMNMKLKLSGPGTELFGDQLGASVYYKDGYMYEKVSMGTIDDIKIKIKYDAALAAAAQMSSLVTDLSSYEKYVTAVTVQEVEGGRLLAASISPSVLKSEFSKLSPDLEAALESLTIKKLVFNLLVDAENNPKTYVFAFDFTVDAAGTPIAASMQMSMQMVSYNNIVSIDFPNDLDSYQEASDLAALA